MSEDLNHPLIPAPTSSARGAVTHVAPAAALDAASQGLPHAEPRPSLLELANKHKRTFGACLGGALLLGGLTHLLIEPTYESNGLLYVQNRESQTSAATLIDAAVQPSTHAAMLTTRSVLKAALASDAVRDLPSIAQLGDRAIEDMGQRLRTGFTPKGETVTVTYRSASREDSATVLRAVLEAYIAQLRVQAGGSAASPGEAVKPRMMDEQLLAGRLSGLGARQANADVDVRLAASRLTEAGAAGDDTFALAALVDASGADSKQFGVAELAYLNTEIKKLGQQLESMPSGWGPGHTIRGPVQRRVDALSYEVGTLSVEVVAALRDALERDHASAVHRAGELANEIDATQTAAAQIARLPVSVLEWPEAPRHKVGPRAVWTLGLAALGGLCLGLILVIRRELHERPAAEPAYALGDHPEAPLALLGVEEIEALNAEQGTPLLGQMPEVRRAPGVGLVGPDMDDPASSIHQIRAVLQIQATATGTRAFAFTSPHRGAGKTSVALGVASSLALSGTRTLVVDCDLAGRINRNRTAESSGDAVPVAARLENDSMPEPADLGHARADHGDDTPGDRPVDSSPKGITGMIDGAKLADCVAATTTAGLSLLPAVNPQPSHISKLSDAFVRRVIDESRDAYDMIIFDTGPVPGSVEALLVASQCDGVVVVVKQGEDRKSVNRTLSYLKVVGARITGTVFNRVPASAGPEQARSVDPAVESTDVAAADPQAPAASGPVVDPVIDPSGDPVDTPAPRKLRGMPLGSGILAAAVFSDAGSNQVDEDFELDDTGDFDVELADVFGAIDDDEDDDEGDGGDGTTQWSAFKRPFPPST